VEFCNRTNNYSVVRFRIWTEPMAVVRDFSGLVLMSSLVGFTYHLTATGVSKVISRLKRQMNSKNGADSPNAIYLMICTKERPRNTQEIAMLTSS